MSCLCYDCFVVNTIGQNICQIYSPFTSLLVSSVLLLIPDRSHFFPSKPRQTGKKTKTKKQKQEEFFFPYQMATVGTISPKLLAIVHPFLQSTHACSVNKQKAFFIFVLSAARLLCL